MSKHDTSEFLVLLDRYLAGDVDADELARIRNLCESDGAFELEFMRALRFESLLSGTLRTCSEASSGEPTKSSKPFDSHPDFLHDYDEEAASDASGIDLLHAGLLSAEDEATLRLDSSEDCWLVDELRDADLLSQMLRDTFREIAGDGPAQSFVGADRIDRYLAGDLATDEIAQLFADGEETTTLGIELESARGFEAMLKTALGGFAEGHRVAEGEIGPSIPWLAAADEQLDRYLAGDLSAAEQMRLNSAATTSQSLSMRLAEVRRFEELIASTLRTAALGEEAVKTPITRPAANSTRARRVRARASLARKRKRNRQRLTAALIGLPLLALLTFAIANIPWGDGNSNEPELEAGPNGRGESSPLVDRDTDSQSGPDQSSVDRSDETVGSNETVESEPSDSSAVSGDEGARELVEPVLPDEIQPEPLPTDLVDEKKRNAAEAPEPNEGRKATDGPVVKKDEEKRATSTPTRKAEANNAKWYETLQLSLSPELAENARIKRDKLDVELAKLVDDEGNFSQDTLEELSEAAYPRRRWFGRTVNLSAAAALVLRARMREAMNSENWKTDRKAFEDPINKLILLHTNQEARNRASVWDAAEVLSTLEFWYRLDPAGTRHVSTMKVGHRDAMKRLIKEILREQKEDGFWGENDASAYGSPKSPFTYAHLVGQEVVSDLYHTFGVIQALDNAENFMGRAAGIPSSTFRDTLERLMATQSLEGNAVMLTRVSVGKGSKLAVTESQALARGWTTTGILHHAKTGAAIPRTGAATAAGLFILKACIRQLSKKQLANIEKKFGADSLNLAERDALAWLETHYVDGTHPGSSGEEDSRTYRNHGLFYVYALRAAFGETGDVALAKSWTTAKLMSHTMLVIDNKYSAGTRECLRPGPINWALRRALASLNLQE